MTRESTFVMIKPDGVERALVGEVIVRLERKGLKLVALKMLRLTRPKAQEHYAMHQGKPFFDTLIEFITSAPVVAMVWEGHEAIGQVRVAVGATDPGEAGAGTIRGDLAMVKTMNLVHASDGPESAEAEINLYFEPHELVSYERSDEARIIESGS